MIYLPTELLDHIFGYCEDEKSTLVNVMQASRLFNRIAERHLYRSVGLRDSREQPGLLLRTLQENTQLADLIEELTVPSIVESLYGASGFQLAGMLPMLRNLSVFTGKTRAATSHLIRATLYKQGSGCFMDVPTDLGNLRTLELFACELAYKYHYIFRLPRLETVVLVNIKVIDEEFEDERFEDDWGWTSSSIKELVLRPANSFWQPAMPQLYANCLCALSRSMPRLESLKIHTSTDPRTERLLGFFARQISSSLRRLELHDEHNDPTTMHLRRSRNPKDFKWMRETLQEARLDHLTIDVFTLFDASNEMTAAEAMMNAGLPPSVRHLNLRFDDPRNRDESTSLYDWDCKTLVSLIRSHLRYLETINLELLLRGNANLNVIERYREEFRNVEISFFVTLHQSPPQEIGLITCSRPALSALPPRQI